MNIDIKFVSSTGVTLSNVVQIWNSPGSCWVISANAVADEFGTYASSISKDMIEEAFRALDPGQQSDDRVGSAFACAAKAIPNGAVGWMTICSVRAQRVATWWIGGDVVYVRPGAFTLPHSAVRAGAPSGSTTARLLSASLSAAEDADADYKQFHRRGDDPVLLLSHSISSRLSSETWGDAASELSSDRSRLGHAAFGFAVTIAD